MLGSHLAEDANGSDDVLQVADTLEGVYNESKQAYGVLSQLAGY